MTNSGSKADSYNAITEGVIWKQLLLFFFPIVFGTFFQQLYNTADAVIVGRFVGKQALSAVGGTTATLINLLVGFFVGVSSGAAVVVSQYYGARQPESVNRAVHSSFCMALAGGLCLMIAGELLTPFAIRAIGTPEDVRDYAVTYMRIIFAGVIPNLCYNMGAAILRAVGDSRRPLYFLIAATLCNILLDLLFVAFLHLEVRGAALATILSQLFSAVLVMRTLMRTEECYRFRLSDLRPDREILRRVVAIGFPAGLQSMMYSISNILIQAGINSHGTDTVAAWAAYGKVDGLFWMMLDAMGIAITTFVGQNYGAGKFRRLRQGTRVGLLLSLVITLSMSVLVVLLGGPLIRLFTDDPEVLRIAMEMILFLTPLWFTYIFVSVLPCTLRAIGDALHSMIIIALGTCGLRILWIFAVARHFTNLRMTIACYPLSWAVTSIVFVIYYRYFSPVKDLPAEDRELPAGR